MPLDGSTSCFGTQAAFDRATSLPSGGVFGPIHRTSRVRVAPAAFPGIDLAFEEAGNPSSSPLCSFEPSWHSHRRFWRLGPCLEPLPHPPSMVDVCSGDPRSVHHTTSRRSPGMAGGEWKLRVRGPKGNVEELELKQGGKTTVKDLAKLAGKLTRVAAKKVKLRAGFPPQDVFPRVHKDNQTLEEIGLLDKGTIFLERTDGGGGGSNSIGTPQEPDASSNPPSNGAQEAVDIEKKNKRAAIRDDMPTPTAIRTQGAAAGTPVPSPQASDKARPGERKPKKRRIGRMPGTGRVLGNADDSIHDDADNTLVGSENSTVKEVENRMAADLVNAAAGGGGQLTKSAHLSLRKSLREARAKVGAESEANRKVSAALLGRVKFRELSDGSGRLEIEYQVGSRGAARKELVTGIPAMLLPAILRVVACDEDPVARKNLKPDAMALVSPRMFWAIVRHGGVGPGKNFHDALTTLAPDINWEEIEKRDRQRPERYADYVSH